MSTHVIKIVSRLRYGRNITSGEVQRWNSKTILATVPFKVVMQSHPEIGEILVRLAEQVITGTLRYNLSAGHALAEAHTARQNACATIPAGSSLSR